MSRQGPYISGGITCLIVIVIIIIIIIVIIVIVVIVVIIFRGNHLSNTYCLTHVFFKSGESCSKS